MTKTCILIPAYNCAPFLEELCRRIPLGPHDEIIVVDDASSDDTLKVAASIPRVFAIRNETNRGYGGTSHRLYQIALERGADMTVNVHGDLGHPPEAVPRLIDALVRNKYDVVLGSRLLHILEAARPHGILRVFSRNVRAGMPPERVAGHLALTWIQNVCYGTRLHSFHEGMRACSRNAIEWAVASELPQWYNYDLELLLSAYRAGFHIGEVPVAPYYHSAAASAAPRLRYGLKVLGHAFGVLAERAVERIKPSAEVSQNGRSRT